ncbi:hypothetical protein [Paracoccus luteus]|uniref:hypothetical protein n=1 Tax=Paracoccus luteus TaxID=2508543 RepID=UPI001430AEA0|nr:hypothetical protein [Paracoccus luteus]
MIVALLSIALDLTAAGGGGLPVTGPPQNVCCVLPNGQQCCSPTTDINGRPNGCGC